MGKDNGRKFKISGNVFWAVSLLIALISNEVIKSIFDGCSFPKFAYFLFSGIISMGSYFF